MWVKARGRKPLLETRCSYLKVTYPPALPHCSFWPPPSWELLALVFGYNVLIFTTNIYTNYGYRLQPAFLGGSLEILSSSFRTPSRQHLKADIGR